MPSPHIHHSDEPNAIIFIQVLALSHRAQVLNLEPHATYISFPQTFAPSHMAQVFI